MTNRPILITVIGCGSIMIGVLLTANVFMRSIGLQTQEVVAKNAVSPPIQYGMSLTGGAVSLVCGFFLLRGKNWARNLLAIWIAIHYSYVLWTSPIKLLMIPRVFIFLLILFFLYRPQASAFFAGIRAKSATQYKTSARQILSICCYIVACCLLSSTCLVAFAAHPDDGVHRTIVDMAAKWMVLGWLSVPSLAFLLIGWALSSNLRRKREVGIVLTASAVVGSVLALSVVLLFMDPEFLNTIPPAKAASFRDYKTGVSWIALIGALGGLALFKSRTLQKGESG